MFRFIAFALIAMSLFWLVFMLYWYLRVKRDNRRKDNGPVSESDVLAAEQQALGKQRRRRRMISTCSPERISPPVKVTRFIDNSRLETYEDGSEAYYDGFGDLTISRADPIRNADR